jgi:hypothetical protein
MRIFTLQYKQLSRILCFIGDHDWTCLAEQGIKPDRVRSSGIL